MVWNGREGDKFFGVENVEFMQVVGRVVPYVE